MKRLSLTRMKLPIARGARTSTFMKASKAAKLESQWAATPFAKKLAKRTTRANLTDIERFQVMINRKKRSAAVKKTLKTIRKKK